MTTCWYVLLVTIAVVGGVWAGLRALGGLVAWWTGDDDAD